MREASHRGQNQFGCSSKAFSLEFTVIFPDLTKVTLRSLISMGPEAVNKKKINIH